MNLKKFFLLSQVNSRRSLSSRRDTSRDMVQVEIGTFASGCFWGTQNMFDKHYRKNDGGVLTSAVGFIGGLESCKNPTYEQVKKGDTGHAEACQLTFDPSKVSYAELVEFFYRTHDPTQLNFQGPDRGTQYRSAIFCHNEEQMETAKRVTAEVQEKHFTPKGQEIVTIIEMRRAEDFFPADEYHQEYLTKNVNGYHCPTHKLQW